MELWEEIIKETEDSCIDFTETMIKRTVEHIAGIQITLGKTWEQAYLSPRQGGIGVIEVKRQLIISRLAAMIDCRNEVFKVVEEAIKTKEEIERIKENYNIEIQGLHERYRQMIEKLNNKEDTTIPSLQSLFEEGPYKTQRKLTQVYSDESRNKLIREHVIDKRRIEGSSKEGAYLITGLPFKKDIEMSDTVFETAIQLRLGTNIGIIPAADRCICSQNRHEMDRKGKHINRCPIGGRQQAHNILKGAVTNSLCNMGYRIKQESSEGLRWIDPNSRERTDITIPNTLYKGEIVALELDVSISSHLAYEGNKIGGTAAAVARKDNKYKNKIEGNGNIFIPFVLNSNGAWEDRARKLYEEIFRPRILGKSQEGFSKSRQNNSLYIYHISRITLAAISAYASSIVNRCKAIDQMLISRHVEIAKKNAESFIPIPPEVYENERVPDPFNPKFFK